MAFKENGNIVMLTEDSQLKQLTSDLWFKEDEPITNIKVESECSKYAKDCYVARDKVDTLLRKCTELGSESNLQRIQNCIDKRREDIKNVNDERSDYLKHVDISMNYVRNWCRLYGWSGLLEYLELETKIFSKKCIKFRKRYTTDNQVEADVQELASDKQYGISEFARDVQEYVKYAINVGLICARNCDARRRWIDKIEMHIKMLMQVLEDKNDGNMQGMADHLSSYKKCMFEYAKNCQKGSIQAEAYNMLLKKEHEQFSDMATKSKMNELGFPGEFDNLTDSQKLEVWCGIINESTSALSKSKTKSCGETSHLLNEYIFGKGDATIREFTKPTFSGANMPNGMDLARKILEEEIKDKKHGLLAMDNA